MTGTGEGFTADDAAITFGEVKSVHDAAESLRGLAKRIGAGLEAQNRCAEIKLRAERRMGDELGTTQKQTGGDAMRARLHDATEVPPKLSDLGINKSQSSRWQAVDAVFCEI